MRPKTPCQVWDLFLTWSFSSCWLTDNKKRKWSISRPNWRCLSWHDPWLGHKGIFFVEAPFIPSGTGSYYWTAFCSFLDLCFSQSPDSSVSHRPLHPTSHPPTNSCCYHGCGYGVNQSALFVSLPAGLHMNPTKAISWLSSCTSTAIAKILMAPSVKNDTRKLLIIN